MSDKLTAVGTLAGITEKPSGWVTIEVARPGEKYPLKMDTKLAPLIELARAAGTNVMEWQYSEHDSGTPNPNKPGSNFINRRFEGVAPVGTTPQSAADATAASNAPPQTAAGQDSGLTKEEWAARDSAIHKMACIKTAAAALSHTMPSDPDSQDLNLFLERVAHLSTAWHRSVIAERDQPDGYDIPFDDGGE